MSPFYFTIYYLFSGNGIPVFSSPASPPQTSKMASKNDGSRGKKRQTLDESSEDSSSEESDNDDMASGESFDENMVNISVFRFCKLLNLFVNMNINSVKLHVLIGIRYVL